ncbi:MAG: hypothetical protein ACE5IR_07070 [bacterium]
MFSYRLQTIFSFLAFLSCYHCYHLYGQDNVPDIIFSVTGNQIKRISPNETIHIIASAEATVPGILRLKIKTPPPFANDWDNKFCEASCSLTDTLTLSPTEEDCGSFTFRLIALLRLPNGRFQKREKVITVQVAPRIEPEPLFTKGFSNKLCWDSCVSLSEELVFFPVQSSSILEIAHSTNSPEITDGTCKTVEGLSGGTKYAYFLKSRIASNGEFKVLLSDTVFSTQDPSSPPAVQIQGFDVDPEGVVNLRWLIEEDDISYIRQYVISRRQTNGNDAFFAVLDTIPFFPVTQIAPANYSLAKSAVGERLYVTGKERIASLPAVLEGSTLIRTSNSDRWRESSHFLTFDLESPATLYIAFDKNIKLRPEWLDRDFHLFRASVTTAEGVKLQLFKSRDVFPEGKVTLGGNFAAGADIQFQKPHMYAVFVQPVAEVFPYSSGLTASYSDPLGFESDQKTFIYRFQAIDAAGNVSQLTESPPVIIDLLGRCKPQLKTWYVAENKSGQRFAKGAFNSISIQDPASVASCVGFRDTDSLRFQAVRNNVDLFENHLQKDVGEFFFDSDWIATGDLGSELSYRFELLPPNKDFNFVHGEEYFYRIRAKDIHGNVSVWSDTVSAVQDLFSPSDISNLTAQTQIFESREDGCIQLKWHPATDGMSGVDAYVIYRSEDSGITYSAIDSVSATQLSYCDTLSDIGRNALVSYKIGVIDAVGNIHDFFDSDWEVSLRALVGPTIAPDSSNIVFCSPDILGTSLDTLAVILQKFDITGIQGYVVEIQGPNGFKTQKFIEDSFGDRLDCPFGRDDGVYTIRVRAFYTDQDTTIFSNAISIRKKTHLQSVQDLLAQNDENPSGDVLLSWRHPDSTEIVEFEVFVWPEGEPLPNDPLITLPGNTYQWLHSFEMGSVVAYQCNNYMVRAHDCFGLTSPNESQVSQYSNRPPGFDSAKTEIDETSIRVFWDRPSPRLKEDDSFDVEVMIYQDSVKAQPDTVLRAFNKTSIRFVPQPQHNYIFQVREFILDDLNQACADTIVSAWSKPLIVPFKNLPNPVRLFVQPLPVMPGSTTSHVFVVWQSDSVKPADRFEVEWRAVESGFRSSVVVTNVDTFLIRELDVANEYEVTVTALDNLKQRSVANDTVRVAFNPRWLFLPKLDPIEPICFGDSVTVKWDWVDENLEKSGLSYGAEKLIVELSIDPNFIFKKTTTLLDFASSHTFHRENSYPFMSEQNDILYVRMRAMDRWNHSSPWSTDYAELGAVSGQFDAIPPSVVTCTIESVNAPIFGAAGEIDVNIQWLTATDNCSGVWYYEITRNDSVVGRDSSRVQMHRFKEKQIKGDESILSAIWKVHAIDRVGNRQELANSCRIPFLLTPPDSGYCVNDSTFCWSAANANITNLEITYFVEGVRFPEFFGNPETNNVLAGQLDSLCLVFNRPWEQIYWRVKAKVGSFESAWSDTFFCSLSSGSKMSLSKSFHEDFIPSNYQLTQNYPNPFNPSTTIRYAIPNLKEGAARVVIEIFNVTGTKTRILVDTEKSPGEYSIIWDGKDDNGHLVGSGFYIYRMRTLDFVLSRKMIFVK